MPLTLDQIKQNLLDRGRAIDDFLTKRREIIVKLSDIHRAKRRNPPNDQLLIMNILEEQLCKQLDQIAEETEAKLTEIRHRRNQ